MSAWISRLFFLSGLSGILFEVLWTRLFTFVLGSGVQSASAVVTSFMLGLGLGAALLGRRADEGGALLRLYGLLELGVAALGTAAFFLFQHVDALDSALAAWAPAATVKWLVFAIAFLFVTVPATLIGGTLPVLVRATVSAREELKAALGSLYAINTLGAAAGAVLALGLVFALGYERSYAVALGINVLTGLGALWRSRVEPVIRPGAAQAESGLSSSARTSRIVLPLFALSGFCALVYEVVWFRTFDFLLLGRLTTFACVLAIYLTGISLGSMAQARLSSRWSDARWFAAGQWLVGVLGLASLPLLAWVTSSGSRPLAIGVFFALIFVTTSVLGALFPVAGKLCAGPVRLVGRATGTVYSANTLGAVLGSFGTAFVLIPQIGTGPTLELAAVLNVAIAAVAGWTLLRNELSARTVALFAAPVLGLGALTLSSDWLLRYYAHTALRPGFEVIAREEGALQTVMVAEDAHGERILLGGPFQSGETVPARRQTQRLQSHLPMLVHPNPQRVLEIGYGVGELARTVLRYHPERLDLVEIDEHMIPIADRYFEALSADASQQPNVHVTVMDGRRFLRITPERYDVVMSDSMILASEGSLRLYTEEHFREARDHLAPGGVMLLWLPLNVGTTKSLVIAKTFLSVFPQSLLWLPLGVNTQEAFLVGFRDQARIDLGAWEQKFRQVAQADLATFRWDDPALFFGSFRLGPEQLARVVAKVPFVNRDMAPVLDFLPQESPVEVARFVERLVAQDPAFILDHLDEPKVPDHLTRAELAPALAKLHQADQRFLQGVAAFEPYAHAAPPEIYAHKEALTADFQAAMALVPEHPAASAWTSLVLDLAPKAQPALTPDQVRSELERALALNPADVTAAEQLARFALDRHRPEEARHYLDVVHAFGPYSRTPQELAAQLP